MRDYYSSDRRNVTLSDFPSVLLTFIVCLSCWTAGYFYSIGFPMVKYSAVFPLWGVICDFFDNKLIVYLVGLSMIVLVAFVMQRIIDRNMLLRERTRLPFLLFILLVSTNSGLLPVREVSIVLICIVFMLYELFNSYQSPETIGRLFNAGVLIGLSGLLIPQVLFIMPLLWIGMYQFRSLSINGFAGSFMGVLIIYWFVLAWCVWTHDFSIFSSIFSSIANFNIISVSALLQYHNAGIASVLLLLIMAFAHIKSDVLSNSVRIRLTLSFLLNMSVWSVVMILLYGNEIDSFLAILYLPMSALITYFLKNIHNVFRFILYYTMLIIWGSSFIIRIWNS